MFHAHNVLDQGCSTQPFQKSDQSSSVVLNWTQKWGTRPFSVGLITLPANCWLLAIFKCSQTLESPSCTESPVVHTNHVAVCHGKVGLRKANPFIDNFLTRGWCWNNASLSVTHLKTALKIVKTKYLLTKTRHIWSNQQQKLHGQLILLNRMIHKEWHVIDIVLQLLFVLQYHSCSCQVTSLAQKTFISTFIYWWCSKALPKSFNNSSCWVVSHPI